MWPEYRGRACCVAGTVALDAHTTILTLCVFLFISFPFGVATASTIRVGNLLGAGRPQQARLAGAISSLLPHPLPHNDHQKLTTDQMAFKYQ